MLDRLLAELPETALVLDVGGWAAPHPRADWVIDLGPYETRNWYETIGAPPRDHHERFTAETWVVHDVCVAPWPLETGQFDFAICSQTLEDLRDPLAVCAELSRVARAGYIETPPAAVELTRGIEDPLWCGWRHHRWLVGEDGSGLTFLAKPHHVHSPLWPAIRSPKLLRSQEPLRHAWAGSLAAREEFHVDPQALDARLLEIVRASSRPDGVGEARRQALQTGWDAYRAVRRRLGRLR
jgi:hypothetical protein